MSKGARKSRPAVRSGFALLAILSVIVSIAVLAFAVSLIGHEALLTAQNRIRLRHSLWSAEGCVERVRAAAASALRSSPDTAWTRLDRIIARSALVVEADCDVELRVADNASVDGTESDQPAEPDAWLLTAHGPSTLPEPRAGIEVRLVRVGARIAILRRRSAT